MEQAFTCETARTNHNMLLLGIAYWLLTCIHQKKFVWFQLSANDDLFRTFWCSFMADVQWYNTSERSKVPYRSTCLQPYPNGGISIIITYFKGICIIFYNNYYKAENGYFYNNYIQHIWPCNIMYFYNSSHSILFHSEISLVAKVIFYI